jgi:hypothetical protein
MSDSLFKVLFGREPKKASEEPDFNRTVRALKTALDNTTPDRPGLTWDSPKKEERDEGPEVI